MSTKTYVSWKHLAEVLLMNTHNICICGEIRKILHLYSLFYLELLYFDEMFFLWHSCFVLFDKSFACC